MFLIYINELNKGLKCKVSKFEDDTKVVTSVRNNSGCIKLQGGLDRLLGWADKWQMNFNSKKCEVLYVGYSYERFKCDMNRGWLETVDQKKKN